MFNFLILTKMKKFVFLVLICFAFVPAPHVDEAATETPNEELTCSYPVGPLFSFNRQGFNMLWEWHFDTSCAVIPCPPPFPISYDIEVEYGTDTGSTIVWGNFESHYVWHLDTEDVHFLLHPISHKSDFIRFRVRRLPSSVPATCSTPWSIWQVYEF